MFAGNSENRATNDNIWALTLDWPGIVGGVNSRGAHDPDDGRSGANISYHVGQRPDLVAQNRRRLLSSLGAVDWPVVCAEQVHGNHVAVVNSADLATLPVCPAGHLSRRTDGLVTQVPELILNLTFADCVPIFMYCPEPCMVAVVHAGWRGTVAQIACKAVEVMVGLGASASEIHSVIGPAICVKCYEVGPEVLEALADLPGMEELPLGADGRCVDLPEINRMTLVDAGLRHEAIAKVDLCTRCGPVPLFSYRASGGRTGLHGGFIGIRPEESQARRPGRIGGRSS